MGQSPVRKPQPGRDPWGFLQKWLRVDIGHPTSAPGTGAGNGSPHEDNRQPPPGSQQPVFVSPFLVGGGRAGGGQGPLAAALPPPTAFSDNLHPKENPGLLGHGSGAGVHSQPGKGEKGQKGPFHRPHCHLVATWGKSHHGNPTPGSKSWSKFRSLPPRTRPTGAYSGETARGRVRAPSRFRKHPGRWRQPGPCGVRDICPDR